MNQSKKVFFKLFGELVNRLVMDKALSLIAEANNLDSLGEKCASYYKLLNAFFLTWECIESGVLYQEPELRTSSAKTRKLFEIAEGILGKCGQKVAEVSKLDQEMVTYHAAIQSESEPIDLSERRRSMSLRRTSFNLPLPMEEEDTIGEVPRIPMSTLQMVLFECQMHL